MNGQTKTERYAEALQNAQGSMSFSNYPAIIAGFVEKGLPEAEIKPRENVFTFNAWRALGRTVRKGEHGVSILTFRKDTREDKTTGETRVSSRPWRTMVFHVTQTELLQEKVA